MIYIYTVNFALRHAFISKVVAFLHRWYIPSEEFTKRSIQNRTRFQDPFHWIKSKCSIMEIDIDCNYNNNQLLEDRNINISLLPKMGDGSISHLFINGIGSIEYNITFPKDIRSLHLQSFSNNLFKSQLWIDQIIKDKKFLFIEYLSLYKCHFDVGQIQYFSFKNCPKLSILELIETTWFGIYYLPSTLKSIRWKAIRGKLSFKNVTSDNLIEVCIPTLSKSIFNCLRNFHCIRRLVFFCKNTFTLSKDDYYHFSDHWDKHKDLKIVYNKVLEKNDKNLRTNLKIIFPNATLQSCDVLQKNDYHIWENQPNQQKYVKMLKAFMQVYDV